MNKMIILCVDDEDIIVSSLKRELINLFGYEYAIETATSGQEALELFTELINNYEIPVVISDYIMPSMKGDELLKRIHALSPKTLKVMLTGQAVTEGVINAINNANLFRYIEKPWKKEELMAVVKEAIEYYSRGKMFEDENKKLIDTIKYLEQEVQKKSLELAKIQEDMEKLPDMHNVVQNFFLLKEIADILDEIKSRVASLDNTFSNDSYSKIAKIIEVIKDIQVPTPYEQPETLE